MPITPEVFADAEALGRAAATLVADRLESSQGRPFLLGCPGGRSPSTTYAALAVEVARRRLDLSNVTIVMMDDYLVPHGSGKLRREDPRAQHSCERFGLDQIVGPLGVAAGPGRGIRDQHFWLPDPEDPEAYDGRIAESGGIDVFLLASGAGDGHIAFNPPGTSPESRTRIVELPETTRRDNLATFPSFGGDVTAVPTHGVTVGLRTITELADEVVMLLHGHDKGLATRRITIAKAYEPDWPATIVVDCKRSHIFVDRAALEAARSQQPA